MKERDNLFSTRVGDSFSPHNDGEFNIKIKGLDKDNSWYRCPRDKTAGWFKGCITVNLFGSNLNVIQTKNSWMGIAWKSFRGSRYSLSKLTMAIRPKEHNLNGNYCK